MPAELIIALIAVALIGSLIRVGFREANRAREESWKRFGK